MLVVYQARSEVVWQLVSTMWKSNVCKLYMLRNSVNLRWSHLGQSPRPLSYLHNPGTEPLTRASLGTVIADTVNRNPGRLAVRSIYEDQTLNYEQLLERADRLGCALRAQGLEKGDRVGIWSHNSTDWVVAMLAAARAGLISVAINPAYEKPELSFCISKTGLKSLIVGHPLYNRNYNAFLNQLIPELENCKPGHLKSLAFPSLNSIITSAKEKPTGMFSIDSLINDYSSNDISKYNNEVTPEDGSIIHFTSGTTGEPKAALDSHLGVVNNTYFTGKRNTFHEGEHRICVQAPLFHALGSVVTALGALRHGASMVIPAPLYNIPANLDALVAEKCTVITGTPTMFIDMLGEAQARGGAATALQVAVAAGAPCSPQLIKQIQAELNVHHVLALYGMTETTACIFQSLPTDSIEQVAETVGYIQDHVEVKVVNNDGEQVPFGATGELMSRGYNSMICYWGEPGKTQDTVDEDGWLATGDKFTISEDGYGRIVGRLKDIIVRGGENIAPKEIEDVINTHPDVIESQVVGVYDARLGEELCCVVRLRPGAALSLHQVRQHCAGRLARFKTPRLLHVTDAFPRTPSGKVQKYRIKEMIEAGEL